jgi:hypothetical protein
MSWVPRAGCKAGMGYCWMKMVRPSRRGLRPLLRLRSFLNVIEKFYLMLRSMRSMRLEARTMLLQPC